MINIKRGNMLIGFHAAASDVVTTDGPFSVAIQGVNTC